MTVLTLYGRPGCTLCDAARRELDEIQATRAELSIREVNIDEDPELHRRFLERVPVIELDGEIVTIFVENGQPVEYGDTLFAIKPA